MSRKKINTLLLNKAVSFVSIFLSPWMISKYFSQDRDIVEREQHAEAFAKIISAQETGLTCQREGRRISELFVPELN